VPDQNDETHNQGQDQRQARYDGERSQDRTDPIPLQGFAAARADFQVSTADSAAVAATNLSRPPLRLAALRTNHLPGQYLGTATVAVASPPAGISAGPA